LAELLREDHEVYDQRDTATTVRMRGWVLLKLARTGIGDAELPLVLEELESGTDAYLVAAAARALRSCQPRADFAPFAVRALRNIASRNEPVSFSGYGEYAVGAGDSTPVDELLAVVERLGPLSADMAHELEDVRPRLGARLRSRLDGTLAAVQQARVVPDRGGDSCCSLGGTQWDLFSRRGSGPIADVALEDQDGARLAFRDFFHGKPAIVAFFYTRCDNPLKCSLTVAKLARVQRLLEEQGLAGRVRTAAVTYDPGFDAPPQLRRYGLDRGVRMDADHRLLRAPSGVERLRRHFELGVNFFESLVNRHRIELFILDPRGAIAARFQRLQWNESDVVDRVAEVLTESAAPPASAAGALPGVLLALFPKCPACWAAYLSAFGIAGIDSWAQRGWVEALLVALTVLNVGSVWMRARATGRVAASVLVVAGALAVLASRFAPGWQSAAVLGLCLTMIGSVWGVWSRRRPIPPEAPLDHRTIAAAPDTAA
jgi:protein SCO1/2